MSWPPACAAASSVGYHSWAYMHLISDAFSLNLFPSLPVPATGLEQSWQQWVSALRSGIRDAGFGLGDVRDWVRWNLDMRAHIPSEHQNALLTLAAAHSDEQHADSGFVGAAAPWLDAFTYYVSGLHAEAAAHLPYSAPPNSATVEPVAFVIRAPASVPLRTCGMRPDSAPARGPGFLAPGSYTHGGCNRVIAEGELCLRSPPDQCVADGCLLCFDCLPGPHEIAWSNPGLDCGTQHALVERLSALTGAVLVGRLRQAAYPLWTDSEIGMAGSAVVPCIACAPARDPNPLVQYWDRASDNAFRHAAARASRSRQPVAPHAAHRFPSARELEAGEVCCICMDGSGDLVASQCCSVLLHSECAALADAAMPVCPQCRAPRSCPRFCSPVSRVCTVCDVAEAAADEAAAAVAAAAVAAATVAAEAAEAAAVAAEAAVVVAAARVAAAEAAVAGAAAEAVFVCPFCPFSHARNLTVLTHIRHRHRAAASGLTARQLFALNASQCAHDGCRLPYGQGTSISGHLRNCPHNPSPSAAAARATGAGSAVAAVAAAAADASPQDPFLGIPAASWNWLRGLPEHELQAPAARTTRIFSDGGAGGLVCQCANIPLSCLASSRVDAQVLGARLWLLFQSTVLSAPPRGGKAAAKEVSTRCRRFLSGDWLVLWEGRSRAAAPKQSTEEEHLVLAVTEAIKFAKAGRLHDAQQCLVRALGAALTPDTVGLLAALHPQCDPISLNVPMPDAIELDRGIFDAVCPSLPQHKASDAGGARYELVKLLHGSEHCPSLFSACSRLAAGALCEEAIDLLDCTRLIALLKPGGIRPLSIGWVLRRVVSTCVNRQVVQKLAVALHTAGAAQFAVAYPGGAEAVAWLLRSSLAAHPELLTVGIDVINAFNEVSRQAVLDALLVVTPELVPMFMQFYGHQAKLIFRLALPWPADLPLPAGAEFLDDSRTVVVLRSCDGVQQGDSLGTTFFALALHPVLLQAAAAFPDCDLSAFADDGRVTGPFDSALQCVAFIKVKVFQSLNLRLKPSACVAWCPAGLTEDQIDQCEAAGLTVAPDESGAAFSGGVTALGAPVGSAAWSAEFVKGKADSRVEALARLCLMPAGHEREALMRHCAGAWLTHLTRLTDPDAADELSVHDAAIERVSLHGLGASPPASLFYSLVSQLPLRHGGRGQETCVSKSPRGYLSSYAGTCQKLCDLYPRFLSDNSAWQPGNRMHDNLRTARAALTASLEAAEIALELLAPAPPSNPLTLPHGTTHAHWTSRLTYATEFLASLDHSPIAHFPRAQQRLASTTHLSRWHQALLCASPVQRSVLHSFSQRGGMVWLEPAPARSLSMNPADFVMVSQIQLGLPLTALTGGLPCQRCFVAQPPTLEGLLQHTASHGGVLWNSNLHAPMVSEIVAAAIAHGVRAVSGEGGSARAGHPHSADARLLNWFGPAHHLRVEVKTGAEFGVTALDSSGPACGRFVSSLDALARAQHAPSSVVAFSISALGCLSQSALSLLSELEARSPLALPRSASLGWTVPSHSVAWQRRFRMVALCGLCTSIRSLFGGPDSALSHEPDCSPDALAMHRHSLRPDLYPPLVEPDSDYCANCFGVPCSCA